MKHLMHRIMDAHQHTVRSSDPAPCKSQEYGAQEPTPPLQADQLLRALTPSEPVPASAYSAGECTLAPGSLLADLRVTPPSPQLSRQQQQLLLALGCVLIAIGQWPRMAPILARLAAALLSQEVVATLVGAASVAAALGGLYGEQLGDGCSAAVKAAWLLAGSVRNALEGTRMLPGMAQQVGGILAELQEVSRSLTTVEGKVL
ncbi:hypothetical protein WJX81_005198 [Elliptochloris bilobata]|uniref:Uncharacterized protein n=1 Tax=Elliptochloris bilobata TaxID=381761 RepID=A0AAW1RNP0_9CHLO